MERTPEYAVDSEFSVGGDIIKSWEDETGRYIRGAASGVEEDRDGERMSERCIKSMVSQVNSGKVTLNGLHADDWLAEMGKVVKATRDDSTGQLMIDTKLPPEGEDPIADKAWNQMQKGKKLGFSVGGKLRKAFYERNEMGKQRKVLDDITLKHVMLTQKPAYQHSFAEAVAKSFTEEPDSWFEAPEEQLPIEKAAAFEGGDVDTQAGQDSKIGDRNAGKNKKGRAMRTEEDDDEPDKDDEETEDAQSDQNGRRLACPNCGHEFAAPLDPDDENIDWQSDEEGKKEPDNERATKKSRQERIMPQTLIEALDVIKSFAAEQDEPVETEAVEKSATEVLTDRIETLEGQLADAFDVIAKSHQALIDRLDEQPVGRKSVFRLEPRGGEVEKSLEERVRDAESPVEALKLLNEQTYGIR